MAAVKFSRQREYIRRNLAERRDHPTADMVYRDVRKAFPNVSLGTVYRNLSLLAKLGDIRRISGGEGADRFDGRMDPHDHFFCRVCGGVTDLPLADGGQILKKRAQKDFAGHIDRQVVEFFGTCPKCLKAGGAKGLSVIGNK